MAFPHWCRRRAMPPVSLWLLGPAQWVRPPSAIPPDRRWQSVIKHHGFHTEFNPLTPMRTIICLGRGIQSSSFAGDRAGPPESQWSSVLRRQPPAGVSGALAGCGCRQPETRSCQGLPDKMQETQLNLNFRIKQQIISRSISQVLHDKYLY